MNKQLKAKMGRSFWLGTGRQCARWILNYPAFLRDLREYSRLSRAKSLPVPGKADLFPLLFDNTKETGFEPHYTYHPAWAMRIIARTKPAKHIDISSILHFSTLLSAFVPVEFYDYRPAQVKLEGLACKSADLTNLPFADNSIESLSCMHTIEHVGLGRYGDPIDPEGDVKAARELSRVMKPGGTFLYVAPMGKPKIEFNAHRIYSYEQVIGLFPEMEVKEFSLVPEDFKETGIIKNASPALVEKQDWSCGMFWFIKR